MDDKTETLPASAGHPRRRFATHRRRGLLLLLLGLLVCWIGSPVQAQRDLPRDAGRVPAGAGDINAVPPPVVQPDRREIGGLEVPDPKSLTQPDNVPSLLKLMALLTILSLAPSILIMTTCFIRFVVVMGLLRQALGTQQLPPNQVVISLSLFLTFTIMQPVWQTAWREGIAPYADGSIERQVGATRANEEAWRRTSLPLRQFMSGQIERTGNSDTVWMLLEYQRPLPGTPEAEQWVEPQSYDDVPFATLASAYMLSELKTAFVIGFQIFLPFLIVDLVVSSILISMGMMMLPPPMISLPFKLLLFVLVDGWYLTIGMLLESVRYAI